MSRLQEFLHGCRDILPLIVGAVPFGVIFGTLSIGAGLSTWQTIGMSALVFAGSAQFIAPSALRSECRPFRTGPDVDGSAAALEGSCVATRSSGSNT